MAGTETETPSDIPLLQFSCCHWTCTCHPSLCLPSCVLASHAGFERPQAWPWHTVHLPFCCCCFLLVLFYRTGTVNCSCSHLDAQLLDCTQILHQHSHQAQFVSKAHKHLGSTTGQAKSISCHAAAAGQAARDDKQLPGLQKCKLSGGGHVVTNSTQPHDLGMRQHIGAVLWWCCAANRDRDRDSRGSLLLLETLTCKPVG